VATATIAVSGYCVADLMIYDAVLKVHAVEQTDALKKFSEAPSPS
jgi:hypothetical protein